MRARSLWVPLAAAGLAVGCGGGGGGGGGGGSGSCTPGASASISITAGGVTPKAVCVLPSGTVTVTNSDAVAHDIESGGSCTELNLGSIAAGAQRTVTLPTTEVCSFHDAGNPSNAAFQGTVAVTSAPASGPGY